MASSNQNISLAFINNKGGCSKSTSLFHIAGEFAKRNYKVLVLDFDKQCDTTNNFLAEEESGYTDESMTVLDYMKGNCSFGECLKKNYIRVGNKKPEYYGIDVLPGDVGLENQEELMTLLEQQDIKSLFSNLKYDIILIDCPPSNRAVEHIVLENIATHVIVPMSCDVSNIRGYGALIDKVNKAREVNEHLKIVGVFYSMYFRRRRANNQYRVIMQDNFNDLFIDVQIPHSPEIVTALEDRGQPMCFYHKTYENPSARKCYARLADEIISRI